jgi:hypothetical protein
VNEEPQGEDPNAETQATKPTRPVDPGPTSTPAERQQYAQDVAAWVKWIEDHPEDATDDDGVVQELETEQQRDAGGDPGDEE